MGQIFPTFKIEVSKIYETVKDYLTRAINEFDSKLDVENPDWETMAKFEEIKDELTRYISEINHIKNVNPTKELLDAYNSCIPMMTKFGGYISYNQDYYNFLNRMDRTKLNKVQERLLDKTLEDMRCSGLGLSEEGKKELTEISEELSKLATKFMQNVRNSRDAWYLNIKDKSELSGVNDRDLMRFKEVAEEMGDSGYTILLASDYITIMTTCENREIRKQVYLAHNKVATEYAEDEHFGSECDNSQIIKDILKYRKEKAELLGFKNFAEYSLRNKMAENPEEVINFLEDVTEKSKENYVNDLKELKDFALTLGIEDYDFWDQHYVEQKYKESKFNLDLSKIIEYFPLPKVMNGLYQFIEKMFGYEVKEIDAPHKYIEELKLLELSKDGQVTGYIYCDLFSRKGKKGGAWMNDYIGREYDSQPIAFVTCNFSDNEDKLIQLKDVRTLFHEFGHALHHTLSEVEESGFFGISGVPWDAVELPSTFMEFFILDEDILEMISGHYETGETLPSEIVDKLKEMDKNLASIMMLRQMEFSLVDMKAHISNDLSIKELGDQFRKENGLVPLPPGINFYNQFGHIFSGGYSAGYYSYKWANVLASDVYDSFEQPGIDKFEMGKKYLDSILNKGGSVDMQELFMNFKGRKPTPSAFLRHTGIVQE